MPKTRRQRALESPIPTSASKPASTATPRPRPTATLENDPGPSRFLDAKAIDGRKINTEDFAGNPAVIFFWGEHVTGIGRQRQLQLIQELYETYPPLEVEFLSVTDRERSGGLKISALMQGASFSVPTVVLPEGEFRKSNGFAHPPGMVLLNADQRVMWKWNGFINARTLMRAHSCRRSRS